MISCFTKKNTLVIDDQLWCYKGEKSTPLLLGHVPGNKDMKVGDVFKIQNDAPFFAFVFEPTYKRWAEIKADLPGWKNSSERFCELLGIERNFDEPLEIAIIEVNVDYVYRPAYEPDIKKKIDAEFVYFLGRMNASIITQPLNVWGYESTSNLDELKSLLFYWYNNKNCCTRLGYTFDYAGINNPKKQSYIGVPEVIIRKGTSVKVIEKIPIEDFHKKEIYNKYFGKK